MILSAILLVFATACTPDGIEEEQPKSTSCESGFILDGSACVPESCGTGRWGNLPVDGDTVYVDMAANEGGDGTETTPYATIQRGLNRAGALGGGLVAVAAGTYPETLEFTTEHADVHLSGRCREMVILDASVGDEETPGIEIDVGYGTVEVAGLTVSGSLYEGLQVGAGFATISDCAMVGSEYFGVSAYQGGFQPTSLMMEDCEIIGNTAVGIFAQDAGTRVSLSGTAVWDTRPDGDDGGGFGMAIQAGAILEAASCDVKGNWVAGIIVEDPGTSVVVVGTSVRDTRPDDGDSGYGIKAHEGASLVVEACEVSGNSSVGVQANDEGTFVTLADTIIRDTQTDGNGKGGFGIEVTGQAILVADSCDFEANASTGVMIADAGTAVTLTGTTIRGTRPNGDGWFGYGIEAYGGATVYIESCDMHDNVGAGIMTLDAGTRVALSRTTIRDTLPDDLGSGYGIIVIGGASLEATYCNVARNTTDGIVAADPGTTIVISHSAIRDTLPDDDGESGYGIRVQGGASLEAVSCDITGNTTEGVVAAGTGTSVRLADTIIRDTWPDGSGKFGHGIEVWGGASVEAASCDLTGNTSAGILASEAGTSVRIRDTTIHGTRPDGNGDGGYGIDVDGGAYLEAVSCDIAENATLGLLAANAGTRVLLSRTTIRDTQVVSTEDGYGIQVDDGASLQAASCDVAGNTNSGLVAKGSGTWITLTDTPIRDTQPDSDGRRGYGIHVSDGVILDADSCEVVGNTSAGIVATDPDTHVTLRNSTISHTRSGDGLTASAAFGLIAQSGAILGATDIVVLSTQGPALLANQEKAVLECSGCLIEGNQFAGAAAVMGGTLTISDSIIVGTTPSTNLLGGTGVYAWPWEGDPPTVTVTNTLIQDNPIAGVWLIGNGIYILSGNTISGGAGEPFGSGSRCGDAVLVRDGVTTYDGSSGLLLQDNVFQDASGSGVFLDDSAALMSGNAYSGNAMDLVVQNQSCDPIPAWYSEAPQHEYCPLYSHPTCHAEFFFEVMPAEPVEEGAALHHQSPPMRPAVASLARSIHPIMLAPRLDHPSYHPSLSDICDRTYRRPALLDRRRPEDRNEFPLRGL